MIFLQEKYKNNEKNIMYDLISVSLLFIIKKYIKKNNVKKRNMK